MRVRLLGGLDVDGLPSHKLGSRKARTLLKVLALAQGQPVSPDRLADVLWPRDPPAQPANQVAVLVSRLRRVVGTERLERLDAGYVLHVDWTDLSELEARVAEAATRLSAGAPTAARAAATAALALDRGPLLADDEGEWVEGERAAADRLVSRAHHLAAEAALAAGDAQAAAGDAARALDADPYDEAALRLLMRAHVAAGRPGSALAACAEVRHRLGEDLGISPTAETETLHDEVVRGEVAGPAGPVAAPPLLAGRAEELARLAELTKRAAHGETLLTVVEGEAGLGKTTLVRHWASTLDGCLVLPAACDELGRELPLQPVLEAVDAYLAGLSGREVEAILGPQAGLLSPLLTRAPPAGPEPQATALPDVGSAQAALFTALVAVVDRAAAGRPVVLAIDDVHLAGELTLSWVTFARRRAHGWLLLATRRPGEGIGLQADVSLTLGPLSRDAAAVLVGDERADVLHQRSGGNPLFLAALAATSDEALPTTIAESVTQRVASLGQGASTLVAAAVLGSAVDVGLLSEVLDSPAATLLDTLEQAVERGLLSERALGFTFSNELVREVLAASASVSRRALLHSAAARVLSTWPDAEPLDVAHHARLAEDGGLAASALIRAAGQARERYDYREAVRLLDEAILLADSASARLARARARLVAHDFTGAAQDAEVAIRGGAGVEGLEMAGWIAYYRRDFASARRYADEGAARAESVDLETPCLCLAGRVRHSQGDLAGAEDHLRRAMAVAPRTLRPLADLWLGDLCVHQGRVSEARELVDRGLLDRSQLRHPFSLPRGLLTRSYAAAMAGDAADALAVTADFVDEMDHLGDLGGRYLPAAFNFRAWILRSLGREEEAVELNQRAREQTGAAGMEEPFNQGTLDLVEGRLLAGEVDAAARLLGELQDADEETGVMVWHQQERSRLLAARLALAREHNEEAAILAGEVAAGAERRGSLRHARLARVLEAWAMIAGGEGVDLDRVERLLECLESVAGLEGWRWSSELARLLDSERLRLQARRRASTLVASTPSEDRPAVERWVGRWVS